MKRIKLGIIGCGVIGSEIAKACQARLGTKTSLFAICDVDHKRAITLNRVLKKKISLLRLDELIKKSDFVIEAASANISAKVVEKCIKKKKRCLVMSVGGLLGREGLLKRAKDKGADIYIPSGAICGIDGLKAAAIGKITSVTLTTKKPPRGLEGAPYLKDKNIDLSSITGETVIFEGSAKDAVKGFPQNVNVSAILSLAGIGSDKTRVKIITSPNYVKNIHEIEITGDFGRIMATTENVPSKVNPKTSSLAILSAIAALEDAIDNVHIGS